MLRHFTFPFTIVKVSKPMIQGADEKNPQGLKAPNSAACDGRPVHTDPRVERVIYKRLITRENIEISS
ncbi:MAG TPA: hypothetical protein VEZ55_16105 [Chitinophagaceae bacterium]|nr:hypothetical protein [Chitinophagaceae bacterium]